MRLEGMSAIGDFAGPLGALGALVAVRPAARCLATLTDFLPKALGNGRYISQYTILGPAFSLAILSDRAAPQTPHVQEKLLSNVEARSAAEIHSTVASLRLTNVQLGTTLHAIVRKLLEKVCWVLVSRIKIRHAVAESVGCITEAVRAATAGRSDRHTQCQLCAG